MVFILGAAFISTLKFLAAMLPVFATGVVAAEFIVALGWVNKMAWVTRPLTRLGNLKPECGASFLTAFLSPAAGNAMLVQNFEAGLICRRELVIGAIVNTFPGIVMHWRTMLPIAIPLIGLSAFVYYGLLVLVGFIKTVLALLMGRVFLDHGNASAACVSTGSGGTNSLSWNLFWQSVKKSRKIIFRVIKTTVPVTGIMFVLIHAGIFDHLSKGLAGLAAFIPLSAKAISIVATRLASNVGAFTVAGNLLYAGQVTDREVVLSLLVGNLLASGMNLRYLIPYYFGIFGSGVGLQVLAISTGLRMVIMTALIWILFQVWI
jgi:hypothetical protein